MGTPSPAPPSAAAASFALTKELSLASDVLLLSWCPTMDLAVVASADGQLHLHRMDWQQLWAVSPEAPVSAVAWRPDGKQIALGHANGALSVLDVESGDVVAEAKAHFSSITTLHWASHAAAAAGSGQQQLLAPQHSMQPHQRFKRLFAPPELAPLQISSGGSAEPPPDPYAMCLEACGAAPWPAEPPGLGLLLAGDARGRVSLWLEGLVQLAEIAGAVALADRPHGAELLQDGDDDDDDDDGSGAAKLLHVLADSSLDAVLTVSESPRGGVAVVAHTLQLLQQHQQPLQQAMSISSLLQRYLQAASKCLEGCRQDWAALQAEFTKRFGQQLQQELSDQGSSITEPQQELLLLLATGTATPPLSAFLCGTLCEAGLRRLARGLDGASTGLHTALAERAMPLVELVVFLLGELRGAVLAYDTGSWLGLQIDSVQQLELQAAALLLRLEQLRRAVTASACQYRAFFSWLLKVVRQLEGTANSSSAGGGDDASAKIDTSSTPLPQCREVLAFLQGQFLHDVVGPELTAVDLSPDARAAAEARLYQGISPAETQQLLALLMPRRPPGSGSSAMLPPAEVVHEAALACSRSVAQQLQHLQSLCESAFEMPVLSISPTIRPVVQLQLLPPAQQQQQQQTLPAGMVSPPTASAGAAAGAAVVTGAPLLQPKQCADVHTYVACLVPAAVAASVPGGEQLQQQQQQVMLVARLVPHACPADGLDAQAVLLQLQPGCHAAVWAFYKDMQLALLLHQHGAGRQQASPLPFGVASPPFRTAAGAGGAGSSSSSLHMLDLSGAPWTAISSRLLHQKQHQQQPGGSALQQCLAAGALVAAADLPSRSRVLAGQAVHQLAVSRSRGLGSLVTELLQLLLLDLEDDDDDDDDDDDEEEEEEEEEEGASDDMQQ